MVRRCFTDEERRAGRRASRARWVVAHPEKVSVYARAGYQRHAVRRRLAAVRASVERACGPGAFDRALLLFEAQAGRCGCCARPLPSVGARGTHVDHDHTTGRLRGILCRHCNIGLGQFADDAARIRVAALYVERFRGS